ncbi:MAG: hypothetical protein Q7T36_03135 [Fluviicoccus sp.]|uniref:hypothetical protein n=1 Tax=Fluviicoccus sp. TaxID=2003552 RepID=UPI00272511D0|nr:hypothetical protein [Fluviicoccus sp.]MDO8329441.1 hypothetical protein [Fluviicoccus sp.]
MTDNAVKFHIIYTDRDMLLSRQAFASWRDIQEAYPGYLTSLGPWSAEEVIEYLQQEYPELEPSSEQQLALCMSAVETVLSFSR